MECELVDILLLAELDSRDNEADPSRIGNGRRGPAILSRAQHNLRATLGCGDGISFWERDDLFKNCDCNLLPVGPCDKSKSHIKHCAHEKANMFQG